MTAQLRNQSYGKSRVRVSRITRTPQRHEFQELTVDLALEGDFAAVYTEGDNRSVIPTDTMKNTVYVLAHEQGIASLEAFACRLSQHFLDTYPHVQTVVAQLEERPWGRMIVEGQEHPHAFLRAGAEVWCCQTHASREATRMRSGFKGLEVLKTTGSGFRGFLQDAHTTLKETEDRIFATTVEAWWPCNDFDADWTAARRDLQQAMLKVFAEQYSPSVQATLFQMAQAALESCRLIDEISITMPNQHHLLVNLAPFGLKNDNVTFVPTEEPHGLIRATVQREKAAAP